MKPDEANSSLPSQPKTPRKPKRKYHSKELRRELFARAYVEHGGNGTKAALAITAPRNGKLTPSSAATLAHKLLNEEQTITLIHKWAEKYRCGPEEHFAALGTALESTMPLRGPAGEVVGEWADWSNRLKAIDIGTKLLRLQPRTGSRADAVAGRAQVHLHLPAEQGPDALEGVADRLRDRQAKRAERKAKRHAIDVQVIDSDSEQK